MTVKVLDGAVFTAPDADSLIKMIHADERGPRTQLADWMAEYARRHKYFVEAEIRTDTTEHFLADIIAAKAMEIIDEKR